MSMRKVTLILAIIFTSFILLSSSYNSHNSFVENNEFSETVKIDSDAIKLNEELQLPHFFDREITFTENFSYTHSQHSSPAYTLLSIRGPPTLTVSLKKLYI